MADCSVYIDGVLNADVNLHVDYVQASYIAPWEAGLTYAGCHDAPTGVRMWDEVRIEEGGSVRFRGNVTVIRPGGVGSEGVEIIARGKRFRLENEPVRINGRGYYIWNRRGMLCTDGQGGEDSPGADGGKWTAGEIVIDILEHALGLPALGSDIPAHHGDACCIVDTYLTMADVAGYTAADWLALDSVVGEFVVDNTSVADAISLLVALNGGFYGWYIHPNTGALVLRDLNALPETDIEAGEHGQWQDAGGTDYRLLGNELTWSLDGVCSTIAIQGTDRLQEEQPANIEGTGNPGSGNLGELEQVAAPWRDWDAAYHALCQETRRFCSRPIDDASAYTPPAGYMGYSFTPRVYVGTDAGAKTIYSPSSHVYPTWMKPCGIIGFNEVPALGVGEKLWGWYWAEIPFTVTAGPDGDAYHCYGYERTRTVYDPAFKHTTSYPQAGEADDEVAMGILAERLLELYCNVRRQGTLRVDEVDFASYTLSRRYNVVNLGPLVCGEASTTEAPECTLDPMTWETLAVNAVEVTWDLRTDTTDIRVANTFFMLEEYSELKRRLEMNLFAARDLDLSEDIYDCQTDAPEIHDDGSEIEPITTTEAPPGTTTTEAPGPTTTVPSGPTTTQPPAGTTTTEAPGTTTTQAPPGTTTTEAPGTTTTEAPGSTTTQAPEPPTTTTTSGGGPGPGTTEAPGPTTTEPAGGTTTEAGGPTTTEPAGGTTTEAEPPTTTTTGCPDSCSLCPYTLCVDVGSFGCSDDPEDCTNIFPTAGLMTFVQDEVDPCVWWFDSSTDTAISVSIQCARSGNLPGWSFEVNNGICGNIRCTYHRPANNDCPGGNYSNVSHLNCEDHCPGSLTVYNCNVTSTEAP